MKIVQKLNRIAHFIRLGYAYRALRDIELAIKEDLINIFGEIPQLINGKIITKGKEINQTVVDAFEELYSQIFKNAGFLSRMHDEELTWGDLKFFIPLWRKALDAARYSGGNAHKFRITSLLNDLFRTPQKNPIIAEVISGVPHPQTLEMFEDTAPVKEILGGMQGIGKVYLNTFIKFTTNKKEAEICYYLSQKQLLLKSLSSIPIPIIYDVCEYSPSKFRIVMEQLSSPPKYDFTYNEAKASELQNFSGYEMVTTADEDEALGLQANDKLVYVSSEDFLKKIDSILDLMNDTGVVKSGELQPFQKAKDDIIKSFNYLSKEKIEPHDWGVAFIFGPNEKGRVRFHNIMINEAGNHVIIDYGGWILTGIPPQNIPPCPS